jgi:hypothetical protein
LNVGVFDLRKSKRVASASPTQMFPIHARVDVGTKVIVLPMDRRADNADSKRG